MMRGIRMKFDWFNGDDVSRGAMLVNSGFLLWNCYLFVLNGWYGVIGICLQVGLNKINSSKYSQESRYHPSIFNSSCHYHPPYHLQDH